MRRYLLAVMVVGALLVAAPFALQLPARAGGGQDMIDDFEPLMRPEQVDRTAAYYDEVFVPLGEVVPAMSEGNVARFEAYLEGMRGVQGDAEKLIPGLAQALGMTPEQVQGFIAGQYPALAGMLASLPEMEQDFAGLLGMMAANVDTFGQVPAGLEHYRPLVRTMEANVENYDQVSSLPAFGLFTWFFVVPGALLVAIAAAGLLRGRRRAELTGLAGAVPVPGTRAA